MAWRQGSRKRASDAGSFDLRLRPQDRVGGPPKGAPKAAPKARGGGRQRSGSFRIFPQRKRGGGASRTRIGRLIYWAAVLALWGVIAVAVVIVWVGIHLPPIQSLEIPKRPPSVLILGDNGATLATRGDMGGAAVPLRELPAYVPNAFIAIEDRRFYSHYAVDPLGIARAAFADVLHRGTAQGGSTLTQQLAKNLFLTQERTVSRKLQEVLLAFWLEHKFSKHQILELYLNRVYFGAGAYGVEAAAQRYFGKSARQLTLAEAAMLAGLVKSPSRLAPTRNPDGAQRRARLVDRRHARPGHDQRRRGAAGDRPSGAGETADRRRLRQLRRRLGDGRGQRSGRPCRHRHRHRHHDRSQPAERRRAGAGRDAGAARREIRRRPGRAGGDDAGRHRARAGRRHQLRREPVRSRHRGEAPARLGVQAVRLSDRARTRHDARHGARRRADLGAWLEAGRFRAPLSRPGDADAGAGRIRSTPSRCGWCWN